MGLDDESDGSNPITSDGNIRGEVRESERVRTPPPSPHPEGEEFSTREQRVSNRSSSGTGGIGAASHATEVASDVTPETQIDSRTGRLRLVTSTPVTEVVTDGRSHQSIRDEPPASQAGDRS